MPQHVGASGKRPTGGLVARWCGYPPLMAQTRKSAQSGRKRSDRCAGGGAGELRETDLLGHPRRDVAGVEVKLTDRRDVLWPNARRRINPPRWLVHESRSRAGTAARLLVPPSTSRLDTQPDWSPNSRADRHHPAHRRSTLSPAHQRPSPPGRPCTAGNLVARSLAKIGRRSRRSDLPSEAAVKPQVAPSRWMGTSPPDAPLAGSGNRQLSRPYTASH